MAERLNEPKKQKTPKKLKKGRSVIALLLIGFVLIASAVIWRRSYSAHQSEELADLSKQRAQLEGEIAKLKSDIREASSRQKLGPIVEQNLGMHVPSDKQVVILAR